MMNRIHHFLYETSTIWKTALASGFSWEVAKLAGSIHPYLAPLSVILCLQVTVDKSVRYGIQRFLGTIAGVLFTFYLAPYVGVNAWSLGLLILVASMIIHWMGFDRLIINQVALSILLVLSFQNKFPNYGIDRIRDTFIGCAVAILVNIIIFPPNFTKQAIKELYTYTDHLSNCFKKTAEWLTHGDSSQSLVVIQDNVQSLFEELKHTIDQFDLAEKSLRYHPFVKNSRTLLHRDHKQLIHLNEGYVHLTNILLTLSKWMSSERMTTEDQQFWAQHMGLISVHIHSWKRRIEWFEKEMSGYIMKETNISDLDHLLTNMLLPDSIEDYRFAFALQNDTLQLLQDFGK